MIVGISSEKMVLETSDDEVPNIEPVLSYDSSSTVATENSTTKLRIQTLNMLSNLEEEEDQLLSVADEEVSLLSPESDSHQHYFSKDELETLVTPTFMDDLEAIIEGQVMSKQAERQIRKELIQRELDALIKAAEVDMESEEGQEFEPEAVEALGVAANRVAYLKKYYDVASCQYIYVPSVAYTILDGTLLEEATKHYFGKSEEFLVVYAASLGSTVIQNRLPQVLQVQGDDDDNLSDVNILSPQGEMNNGQSPTPNKSMAAIQCWGVSPKSRPSIGQENCSFDTPPTDKISTESPSFHSHLPGGVVLLLFVVAAISGTWILSRNAADDTFTMQPAWRILPIQPSFQQSFTADLLAQTSQNCLSKAIDSKASRPGSDEPSLSASVAKQRGRISATNSRPIVPNLLY